MNILPAFLISILSISPLSLCDDMTVSDDDAPGPESKAPSPEPQAEDKWPSPDWFYKQFYPKYQELDPTVKQDNNAVWYQLLDYEEEEKHGIKALRDSKERVHVLYRIHKKAEGNIGPKKETDISMHYKGCLINGQQFDSSFATGQPLKATLDQFIKGQQVAIQHMVEGDIWEIYIPSEKAYGTRGTKGIPPHATIMFVVELLGIKGATRKIKREDL